MTYSCGFICPSLQFFFFSFHHRSGPSNWQGWGRVPVRRGPGEKPNLDSLFPKNILVKITTKFSEVPTFQYFPQTFCLNKKEAFGPFIAPILSAANEPLIKKKKKSFRLQNIKKLEGRKRGSGSGRGR